MSPSLSNVPAEIAGIGSTEQKLRVSPGFDPLKAAVLGPQEYFVLSRIDGLQTLRDVLLTTGLPVERAISIVRRLRAIGALLSTTLEERVPGLSLVVCELKGEDVRLDQSPTDRLGRRESDAFLEKPPEDPERAGCVALGRKAIPDQRLFADFRPAAVDKCAAVPLRPSFP